MTARKRVAVERLQRVHQAFVGVTRTRPGDEALGAYSARQSLTGTLRFLRRSDVHEFFHRAPRLHAQFQDFGTAAYEELGPTRGRMRHGSYTSYSPLYCASAIGFHRQCIRLHGGMHVEVRESACQCLGDDACVFELAWE